MQRKHLVIGAIVAVVVAGVIAYLMMCPGGSSSEPAGGAPGRDGVEARKDLFSDDAVDPLLEDPDHRWNKDPDGTLLLEGQVLDEHDEPVAGAQVWVSSTPPRSATTEGDGSFGFDKLLPREYAVTARAGDATGGPVMVRVTPTVQPVVVRLRQGATLTVRVSDEVSGAAVVGAEVEVEEMGRDPVKTGADGAAAFRGLAAGWSSIEVRADGYAPATALATIGSAGSSQEVKVALRKGAALAGKVVDEAGAAVADAWVTLDDAAAPWSGSAEGVSSAADGTFKFAVVAAGSYTVRARDQVHAPGASEIITVDGATARDGVTVTMKTGGILRGKVVTSGQQPAPFATVQVAPNVTDASDGIQTSPGDSSRSTTADAQGAFEIKGLPRAKLRLRASNTEAASAITDVDLGADDVVDGLTLVLDVDGIIAGVVVDADGEPVAEAQVSAFPDIFSGDGAPALDDLALAGLSSDTTDGGGAFQLHGLPDGKYRLWASRTQAGFGQIFGNAGTQAATGDTTVRIVLPKPGGVSGELAFADGKAPALATVQVGIAPPTSTTDGAFEILDLPPGKHDLRVRGPDFAELTRRDVVIEAGKTTDLGTITLSRGRRVAGKVVDAEGAAVAGARVTVGQMLFSQGTTASASDAAMEDQLGMRVATSAADGSFSIQGAPAKGGAMMAEHVDRGRSDALELAAGDGDVLDVKLTLHGYGSVHGVVKKAGQPLPDVGVMASSTTSKGHAVVVQTSADGTFVIDKLPAGTHKLQASAGSGLSMATASSEITVKQGERTEAVLEFAVGKVTLTVEVKGKDGATIDAAQVFLFNGKVAVTNAKEAVDRFLAGDAAGMTFWFGGSSPSAKFEQLVAGSYTVCALPVNGPMMDPAFQQRLQEAMDQLKVHCQGKTVTASPEAQTSTLIVPPMAPLE